MAAVFIGNSVFGGRAACEPWRFVHHRHGGGWAGSHRVAGIWVRAVSAWCFLAAVIGHILIEEPGAADRISLRALRQQNRSPTKELSWRRLDRKASAR